VIADRPLNAPGGLHFQAVLPSWLDVSNVRSIALIVVIGAAIFGLVFLFKMQRQGARVFFVLLALTIGLGAWFYRAGLADCTKDCSCSMLGYEVPSDVCTPNKSA
jgi:hypothetical protein